MSPETPVLEEGRVCQDVTGSEWPAYGYLLHSAVRLRVGVLAAAVSLGAVLVLAALLIKDL